MTKPTAPANHDYYKQRKQAGQSTMDRTAFIAIGIGLQIIGCLLFGLSTNDTSGAAFVLGIGIAWVGVMFLFVGLVAVGVRLGTDELIAAARQQIERDG
jgi:hypothetical protein